MLRGKKWLGSVYDLNKFPQHSSQLIAFPSEKNCFRCTSCGAFLGSERNVEQARLWKNEDGNTLLEVKLSQCFTREHQHEDMGLCYHSCWSCGRLMSTTDDQNVFGSEMHWIPAKLNGSYVLGKCPFRLLFCTLSVEDHSNCIAQLRQWAAAHPSMNIIVDTYDLPLASLRTGTVFPKLTNDVDLVVIGHLAEGRLLLTDSDGLYNSFLAAACNVTLGNVVVVITSEGVDEMKADMDERIVRDLVDCGQSSAEHLYSQQRLLSCRETLSTRQLDIMERHCCHLSSPLELPPGIAQRAMMGTTNGESAGLFAYDAYSQWWTTWMGTTETT